MRVWANLFNGDAVARFDPTTATWTEFPLPTRGVEMRHIAFTEQNGTTEIVLSYFRAGKVARMQFRTTEQLESLQAQVRAAEVQAKK